MDTVNNVGLMASDRDVANLAAHHLEQSQVSISRPMTVIYILTDTFIIFTRSPQH